MQKTQDISRLCTSCNKFFANSSTNYLCSSCFKKNPPPPVSPTLPSPNPPVTQKSTTPNEQKPKPKEVDPERCWKCKKNVGLLGTNCKCGMVFCNKHRMPEDHECEVDYRKVGKELLTAKKVESVAPRKVSEI